MPHFEVFQCSGAQERNTHILAIRQNLWLRLCCSLQDSPLPLATHIGHYTVRGQTITLTWIELLCYSWRLMRRNHTTIPREPQPNAATKVSEIFTVWFENLKKNLDCLSLVEFYCWAWLEPCYIFFPVLLPHAPISRLLGKLWEVLPRMHFSLFPSINTSFPKQSLLWFSMSIFFI